MGDNMSLPLLAPTDIQFGQLLIAITTAVFVRSRFLPTRYRPIVGRIMTICYLVGATMLIAYVLFR